MDAMKHVPLVCHRPRGRSGRMRQQVAPIHSRRHTRPAFAVKRQRAGGGGRHVEPRMNIGGNTRVVTTLDDVATQIRPSDVATVETLA